MTLCVRLLRGVYTEFNEVLAMTTRECHCEGVKRPKQSHIQRMRSQWQEKTCGKLKGIIKLNLQSEKGTKED